MKLRVIYSVWSGDGFDALSGGVHDLAALTEQQGRSIAAGAAAGVLEVVEASKAELALLDGHVQSQEDGEAAYAAALGDWVEPVYETLEDGSRGPLAAYGYWTGAWQRGSLEDYVAVTEHKIAYLAASEDVAEGEKAAKVDALERDLAIARDRLASLPEEASA